MAVAVGGWQRRWQGLAHDLLAISGHLIGFVTPDFVAMAGGPCWMAEAQAPASSGASCQLCFYCRPSCPALPSPPHPLLLPHLVRARVRLRHARDEAELECVRSREQRRDGEARKLGRVVLDLRREERAALKQENENLRMQIARLNERPDNKMQRELEILARAEKQMVISAPGFATPPTCERKVFTPLFCASSSD